MSDKHNLIQLRSANGKQSIMDRKLAAYLAAVAGGSLVAKEAAAVVVSNSTVQPFGINEAVSIDFNGDTQTDYQIDHDRVDLGGGNFVDYLQLDKNDVSGAGPGEDPLAFPSTYLETFPVNGTPANDTVDAKYVVPSGGTGVAEYPAALLEGQEIGLETSAFDFQEGDNAFGGGDIIRANRLIDEDHTQVDTVLGGHTSEDFYPIINSPGWVGTGGQVRYLGVQMDFQNENSAAVHYGWIGVRITNEADATGEVVGWGYETDIGVSIMAGETGTPIGLDGDYNHDGKVDAADYVVWRKTDGTAGGFSLWKENFGNMQGAGAVAGADTGIGAVPEPSSLLLSLGTGVAVVCAFLFRRIRGS
jgi:hypothetical protein